MLVLMRHEGESIIIGDDIKIVVNKISGKQVRIAIDAPKEVSVHREEIYKKIQKQKNNSNKENSDDK